MSSLILNGNDLVLRTGYDRGLVGAIKALPYADRVWDKQNSVWRISPAHAKTVADLVLRYTGEVLSLPAIPADATKPVVKVLEIRYLGTCKVRDDGVSSAFGMVGNNWSVIFPETVLRRWFDSDIEPTAPGEPQTYYQVLGVRKTATDAEIKTAFRRMAMQWHPDVCKETNATEMFLKIQEAQKILSSTKMRARYDAGLEMEQRFLDSSHTEQKAEITAYRTPLRCGYLMVEGLEKLGRVEVSQILAWKDITRDGKTLIVSWAVGAKEPTEIWR